ncbi:BspA family leucine-rich repeat surface protein [Candidatus Saccharibacteria bacterium]|nr:BspA family leucine-rich repeat surface protein [Candidatus Saccharibacteria bacterium]
MLGQIMQSRKPHGVRFNRGLKLFGLFLTSIAFFNLVFSDKTSALYIPTLSASVDNADASVNGNQVINSTNKTTEIPLNLTVSTNNKTGYTATLSSETDETALVNDDSTNGAKINSISAASALSNFSDNTWGVKIGSSTNFSPIPKSTSPMNIMQTDGKTYDSETNGIKIGLKLGDNLESGSYTNKLVFSILTNNYDRIALMTRGTSFNAKLKSIETVTNKIERFKKSTVAPATSMSAVNVEDETSDYEIKLWLDPTDKTAYYYAEPEKVYLNTDSGRMFNSIYYEQEIKNILEIDLSNFDTSKVTNMSSMFGSMSKLTTLNLSSFNTSKVADMSNMFYGMSKLTNLNLSNFDTSKVTDMSGMFSIMPSLTTLDISSFDTSKVTNMGFMFSDMYNLTTLDISIFDTSKVTYMRYMFNNMSKLTTLNLSHFDTSKVTNMGYMFSGMSNLTNLDLSSFDTSMVTNMYAMFSDMSNLTALNLSNFDTSKVTTMYAMFRNMPNLTTLDLSNFDTSQVTDMKYMFYLPYKDKLNDKLEKIYVNNDFNTASLTDFSEMFKNRNKLRGGNGSFLVNPGTADKSWLRIDDPTNGRPGYFTRKP